MSGSWKLVASVWALACCSAAQAEEIEFDEGASSGDADIVVTAQRRSERLVDVPISITTATPADLERAGGTSIDNLTKLTPGVYLQRSTYGLSPTIRGIGSTLVTSSGEQNVALYVDNVYYPAPTGNVFDLASVAGVEVLKGPQGTLFGRNATGGAILVRTRDPGADFEGRFNLSYERFDQVRSSAYVNVPLTDHVAVNGSVAYRYSGGYIRDLRSNEIVNEGYNFTARGKILLRPAEDLSIVLTAAHAELDDPTGTMSQSLEPAPVLVLGNYGPIAKDRFHTSKFQAESTRTSTDEYSARVKLETGAGTLSSYTAVLKNSLETVNDLAAAYFPSQVRTAVYTDTFSQEVNFASSPGGPLSYVVGAYYFRNKTDAPGTTTNGNPVASSSGRVESIAGYLDGSYSFGDLTVLAGMRYSHEKRNVASAPGAIQPAPYTRFQEASESQWTPRFGLKYALGARSNIYATYSKGFKSGIFDAQSAAGVGVRPETVDAFEAGFKTASSNLTFNAAGFYYDYKDTQVTAVISGQNGTVFSALFNVPKARIYGAEADATVRLNENFDIRLAAAYTNSRYVEFNNAPGWVLLPGALTFANVIVDASGKSMVRAPKYTVSSTLNYRSPIGSGKEIDIAISPYFSSRVYHTFDNALSQKSYLTLDATATLTLNERVKLSLFGRNLTDSDHVIRMAQNTLTLNAVVYAPPRSYGVSVGYAF
jgi:Outer membrane receptor proteins, mostly Fe transport